jgi:uncharacterized membrane protein YhaH (DUF805 family)
MHWYLQALSKYAEFSGRASRKEYWMFQLLNVLIVFVLGVMDGMTGFRSMGLSALLLVYCLATVLPGLAVLVRRLHDINRSGWWVLVSLVPFGGLVLLIFACLDSDPGPNQYGPNPKLGGFRQPAAWAAAAPYGTPGATPIGQPTGPELPPQSGTTGAQGFCMNCGTLLTPGNRFCTKCGTVAY